MSQNLNYSPPGIQTTCGLFNTTILDETMQMNEINDTDNLTEFEECLSMTDYLLTNFSDPSFEPEAFDQLINLENMKPTKEKSKFAKKLEEANLRIQIQPSNNHNKNLIADLGNPIIDNDMNQLITPGIEKTFNQLLQSIPTCEIYQDDNLEETNGSIFDLLNSKVESEITSSVPVDHAYFKQKEDLNLDDLTNDSYISNVANSVNQQVSTPSSTKKKRARGVYRKDDIRNEEDYQNYILRRKKNNISSKISRANKRDAYKEIDSKINHLFKTNEILKKKVDKLENLNKVIKDLLVNKLAAQSG